MERLGATDASFLYLESPTVHLHVTGVLEFDEQRIAAVGSRISGRVKEVRVIEGTKVKVGDMLATLESAELGKAQAEIFSVKARAQYAGTDPCAVSDREAARVMSLPMSADLMEADQDTVVAALKSALASQAR